MKTIAFFNNKGGVGKTSLVYHVAHMFAELQETVVTVDLDPQANLTSMFLTEDRLREMWDTPTGRTVYEYFRPVLEHEPEIEIHPECIKDNLYHIAGDLRLSLAEDELSRNWNDCLSDTNKRAFKVEATFWRMIKQVADAKLASVVLIDVGPNLGAINRSALIAAHSVVIPVAPDLFSRQGLQNLGPRLRVWRKEWKDRMVRADESIRASLPPGEMRPIGYVVLQHAIRGQQPVTVYQHWIDQFPRIYRNEVLADPSLEVPSKAEEDPFRLSLLRYYRSLIPMAMQARKPIFDLKPADGAIGAHVQAVMECKREFEHLTRRIADKVGIQLD